MNFKINKDYLPFYISIILFLIGSFYLLYLYLTWNRIHEVSYYPEVSLPVMEWQKYSNLSKQYKDITINNN